MVLPTVKNVSVDKNALEYSKVRLPFSTPCMYNSQWQTETPFTRCTLADPKTRKSTGTSF